ncbi:MAG TPA: GtrA family protein [Candidatus Competibacteraceae bacterium]|nr:GtrA family protein [Candidatus Competibacteraceae bacterium]
MKIHVQLSRYVVVGLVSNAIGYLLYILLTTLLGIGHKTSMTLLYVIGTLQTFVFNKRWTFEHDGATHKAFMRYIAAYAFGYLLNLLVLLILVDQQGLPHQWVQGVMIISLAAMLFLLQRYWIFRPSYAHPL